ncbi:DeoR/GlpR family DNA-binding transcription regulator [Glaciimonas sp. PCH181]|uniref:DeoR/GlpR family DNA-binding transcription regulator n=1 Tax=Glaciimonas sp. PCH181 TaxID=2133943 RepID=UPI000D360AFC|nr:DeoR/GlpR family DNA-binding transcription regulator [Glaciimonas sp. PCH181]PUA19073.1 DeoR family transcriptional regulator [Glaciimonas sp. PCH181]
MTQTPVIALNVRQQEILNYVQRESFVTVENLANRFGMTQQTIRRDINMLSELNLLQRYHGGVGLPSSAENIAYGARQGLQSEEKRRIAALVAEHIPDQATLFINIGTTTEEVAKALSRRRNLRVITNNLNVAAIMSGYPGCEVIIAGGVVRARDLGVTGEETIDFIQRFKVDFGIIGVSSIDPDGALRDFDYREVRVAEAIIAHSRTVFLVADHSKFMRSALVKLSELSKIDALFTDKPIPESLVQAFKDADTDVFVADKISD